MKWIESETSRVVIRRWAVRHGFWPRVPPGNSRIYASCFKLFLQHTCEICCQMAITHLKPSGFVLIVNTACVWSLNKPSIFRGAAPRLHLGCFFFPPRSVDAVHGHSVSYGSIAASPAEEDTRNDLLRGLGVSMSACMRPCHYAEGLGPTCQECSAWQYVELANKMNVSVLILMFFFPSRNHHNESTSAPSLPCFLHYLLPPFLPSCSTGLHSVLHLVTLCNVYCLLCI